MFLPWVVITGDFTKFLPAGKNTFGHGKNCYTKNNDQKLLTDVELILRTCLKNREIDVAVWRRNGLKGGRKTAS